MTHLLEQTVTALRGLNPDMQDHIAHMILQMIGQDQTVIQLSRQEAASFEVSLAQEVAADFASEAEIQAIWAKYSL